MPADEHHIAVPQPQATSSHMMKTTKRGRPFLKVRYSAVIYDVWRASNDVMYDFSGYTRPFRDTGCFSRPHNTQAILQILS